MSSPTGPILRLLLRLRLDPDASAQLLSELAELHAIRAARDGERAAARWLARERRRLAAGLLTGRISAGTPHGSPLHTASGRRRWPRAARSQTGSTTGCRPPAARSAVWPAPPRSPWPSCSPPVWGSGARRWCGRSCTPCWYRLCPIRRRTESCCCAPPGAATAGAPRWPMSRRCSPIARPPSTGWRPTPAVRRPCCWATSPGCSTRNG